MAAKRNRNPRRDSERCSIVNRTVSFNIEDPFQAQLLELADSWTNFSGSVKRFIASSLSSGPVVQVPTYTPTTFEPVGSTHESDDAGEWDPLDIL